MKPLQLDGSSGGGQMLRTALSLAENDAAVYDARAADATLARLRALGQDVRPGTDAQTAARQVQALAWTQAPWGVRVELVLGLAAAAIALALLVGSNDANLTLFWQPYRIDLSLNLVLLLLLAAFVAVHVALRALAALFEMPRQARRWRAQQKERATHAALLEPKSLEELFDTLAGDNSADVGGRLAQATTRLFGVSDLDLATRLFDAAGDEETWDTESLSHHRSYPEERLLAHERLTAEEDARRQFLEKVATWKQEGYAVDFVVSKEGEEQRIRELLDEHTALRKIKPRYLRGTLNEGFRLTSRDGATKGRVVVSETEIFGRQRAIRRCGGQPIAGEAIVIGEAGEFRAGGIFLPAGDLVVSGSPGFAGVAD